MSELNNLTSSMVMAIGVGGGGGNAVNHLYKYGNKITCMLCNTDKQALRHSDIPDEFKVQLGSEGLGAGNEPKRGRELAEESEEKIREVLEKNGIKMSFVIAGMGGGTGTGAAPIVAKVSKELDILTIGVVTIPFASEGRPRIEQAVTGIEELIKYVDSLIVINNANIVEIYGDLGISAAYFRSNEMIQNAVASISDIIDKTFMVNVDFADVCKVMRNSGVALMGTGMASGENRAIEATKAALTSPLLQHQDIAGSKNVLVCITSASNPDLEVRMAETQEITQYIQRETQTGNSTDIIWGAGHDDNLEENLQVKIIATGFDVQSIPEIREYYARTISSMDTGNVHGKKRQGRNVVSLDDDNNDEPLSNVEDKDNDAERNRLQVDEYDDEPFVKSSSYGQYQSNDISYGGHQPRTFVMEDDEPEEAVVYNEAKNPQEYNVEEEYPENEYSESPVYNEDEYYEEESSPKSGRLNDTKKKLKGLFKDMFGPEEEV